MSSRKSVMGHRFSEVPKAEISRSSFNRSSGLKTTFDAGYLVPVFVDEALPGDTFNLKMHAFCRLATPLHPVMDNLFMETFFFFVPNRLVWSNWKKFNGEQDTPGDSTDFTVPIATIGSIPENTLYDYFGLPTGTANLMPVNQLHARAYNLIYNEWFRDENLQAPATVDIDDGPDDEADYVLLRRGKRHDYFTSCLPWPQKGDSVSLPLGTSAPVTTDAAVGAAVGVTSTVQGGIRSLDAGSPDLLEGPFVIVPGAQLYADLSTATAATINELRQAFQIQKLLERDARGGTRYTEVIKAHFGVTSPDARLQRPEYLGGGSTPIMISPIAQTGATEPAVTPQGNLAAIGTATLGGGHSFSKSFTEHGVIIGLVNVRADLTYQQGLDRMWTRQTRYDFFWPALQHIGEQAVLRQEIYATGVDEDDETVFGYQERYAEYRYKQSRICGEFRSNAATPLDSWHLAQDFGAPPVLGTTFIQDTPPVDRILAVSGEPQFLMDAYFSLTCARPMPVYGVPGLIDHF